MTDTDVLLIDTSDARLPVGSGRSCRLRDSFGDESAPWSNPSIGT